MAIIFKRKGWSVEETMNQAYIITGPDTKEKTVYDDDFYPDLFEELLEGEDPLGFLKAVLYD